jgi:hypothetical protein
MGRVLFGLAMGLVCLQATPFIALEGATGQSTTLGLPAGFGDVGATAAVDRSPEMGETDAIVASPQMISSVQLSFDAKFDLGSRPIGGTEGFFDARRLTPYARNIDRRQVDLTLGVAFKGLESEAVNFQSMGNSGYMSFSLVNQAHISTRPAVPDDEPEEEDSTLLEGKP